MNGINSGISIFAGDPKPFFVLAKKDGVITGIAPMLLGTEIAGPYGLLKLRRLTFHGLHFVDTMDFLSDGRSETLEALSQALLDLPGWDVCELRRLQHNSPTLAILADSAAAKGLECETQAVGVSPYLPLIGTFDEYYAGIGKEWRTQGERKRRKMERETGCCRLEIVTQPGPELLATLRDLAVKRREAGDLRRCPLLDPARYHFLAGLLPEFAAQGHWRLALLYAGDSLAAYQICFALNGTTYLWSLAHHPDFETYSPGKLLLRLHLEACFNEGYTEFDFMAGDESYKGHWTSLERVQASVRLSRPSWRTRLNKLWEKRAINNPTN